jgi:hypothetical protein
VLTAQLPVQAGGEARARQRPHLREAGTGSIVSELK